MTNPTPLSPAAQAVMDAAARRYGIDGDLQDSIAAALRAAALYCKRDSGQLLSLADELEGHGPA